MGQRPKDGSPVGASTKRPQRRRSRLGGSGDLPTPLHNDGLDEGLGEGLDEDLDENLNTQELLERGELLLGEEEDDKDSATLVDLSDDPPPQGFPSGEESEELSDENSLSELAATSEVAARTDQSSVEGSGSWIGSDTQELGDQVFEEPSEESAQTQSISEALTGEVSASFEGSITGSDGWLDGPSGEQRTPSGGLDGPDDLASFRDAAPIGPHDPPPSTTSYDFNEEASGDMLGIILEETREFPDLDPDGLPDPTGPLFSSDERLSDTSQEIDELLGAEVSAAVRSGVKALRRGQRQEALQSFERALRGDPDDAMAQAYLRLAQELFIREIVPGASLASVPRLRVGRKMLMTLDLTPEDGAVLALIDGATTLEELETMLAHMDRETVYRCLARAQENGLIEFMT